MFKFAEHFTKNYDEDSNKGYILQADDKYPNSLHVPQNNLPFLLDRMKIKKRKQIVGNLWVNCCTQKKFKAGFESCITITKSTESNNIQAKSLVEAIH